MSQMVKGTDRNGQQHLCISFLYILHDDSCCRRVRDFFFFLTHGLPHDSQFDGFNYINLFNKSIST